MRIIYPHPMEFPNKKAHSIQMVNTCWALAENGVDVTLIVSKLGKKTVKECLDFYGLSECSNLHIDGPTQKFGRKKFNLFVIRKIWKYRKDKDTILFFRDKKLARLFILLSRFLKIPCIMEVHSPGYQILSEKFNRGKKQLHALEKFYQMFKIRRHKSLEKFLYRNADGLICQTEGIRKAICDDFPTCTSIDVVPSATKLMDRQFENSGNNILYLGHLYPQKGVDILIEALKYLPNRKLFIVGGNKKTDISRIRNLSSYFGVNEQVIFAGCVPHSEIEKYFKGAGVAVIPITDTIGGRLFTSPMKLFEYMAAKIPVVASDFPSMREILENGKTAVLVESDNPKALADGIEKILTDREFARKISEQAYEKVKNFSWEKRAEKIIKFIETVCDADERRF